VVEPNRAAVISNVGGGLPPDLVVCACVI